MSRIAIIIGVNKPKTPAPLQGAVNDARAFAEWIAKQGFEVKTFTDDTGKVAFSSIFEEVERVVSAATYSQVVLYFAGHGFQSGSSEIWLLSGAPNNPSEAISVEASVMAARESGLKSVVLISDACRSIPAGLQSSRVDGGSIFPNAPLRRRTRPEIDRVFATLPSLVAVEAAKADDTARRGGIFTREFMRGYRDPPPSFIDKISENGHIIEVVTNRKLKDLVRELVEDAASEEMARAGQTPEFILESVEAYVGRVERRAQGELETLPSDMPLSGTIEDAAGGLEWHRMSVPPPTQRHVPAPSIATLAREAIDAAKVHGNVQAAAAAADGIDSDLGFGKALDLFSQTVPVERFETQTGFSLTGARVESAACQNFRAEPLDGEFVRLWPEGAGAPSASVLIEFDSGNGVVLPGLRGYIGHIFVDRDVVINVNYVPATNSSRWQTYQYVRSEVEALRAAVAAAAGLGVFRIAPDEAEPFADKIREHKAVDPTLGLYAAYAYASAGRSGEVRSVLKYMREDIGIELFDVAMLARRKVRPREESRKGRKIIQPFCPVLRQGWSLLAVRDAQLPDVVHAAREWLLPALWTTFAPEGVKLLREAIQRGDFQ